MFQATVRIQKNINGRVETIEKTFTNPVEYQKFLNEHKNEVHVPFFRMPRLGWNMHDWFNDLYALIDDIVDYKLGYCDDGTPCFLPEGVDVNLNKYREERKKLEYEEAHKEEQLKYLKNSLEELKEQKEYFSKKNKHDLVEEITADIKKVEEKIAELEGKKVKNK